MKTFHIHCNDQFIKVRGTRYEPANSRLVFFDGDQVVALVPESRVWAIHIERDEQTPSPEACACTQSAFRVTSLSHDQLTSLIPDGESSLDPDPGSDATHTECVLAGRTSTGRAFRFNVINILRSAIRTIRDLNEPMHNRTNGAIASVFGLSPDAASALCEVIDINPFAKR